MIKLLEKYEYIVGEASMGLQKNKFALIVFFILVLAGGGWLGHKFYQKEKSEAAEVHQKSEKVAIQKESGLAETKVISAEMNPNKENIEEAEATVNVLPKSKEKQKLMDRLVLVKEEFHHDQKIKEEARLAELKDDIQQAKIALGIDHTPSEAKLLEILHNMTHQKVRSEEKWGFVQMTEVNLLAVKEVLQENPSFNQNIDMLAIVTDWLNNHFNNIVADHNLIWEMKDGSVGKAYGILSTKEEEDLIREQFGTR